MSELVGSDGFALGLTLGVTVALVFAAWRVGKT